MWVVRGLALQALIHRTRGRHAQALPALAEALALVAEGLTNRAVGNRLHIAESTVKSHLNHVYGKLAVDNRTQAVAKARTLNLFD